MDFVSDDNNSVEIFQLQYKCMLWSPNQLRMIRSPQRTFKEIVHIVMLDTFQSMELQS